LVGGSAIRRDLPLGYFRVRVFISLLNAQLTRAETLIAMLIECDSDSLPEIALTVNVTV
jgi:hypothetical protein